MASKIIGRTTCPIKCGSDSAHVKIKTDKVTAAFPYVHCRNCGAQTHTKNEEQAGHLAKITRPEIFSAPAVPEATPAAINAPGVEITQEQEKTPPAAYTGRFGRAR